MSADTPSASDDPSDPLADDVTRPAPQWGVPPVSTGATAPAYDFHIPTPEEVADLRPVQDLFVAMLDVVAERTLGRPLRPRLKVSPQGMLRGEIDLVKIELPSMPVGGLVIDRFIVQAEHVRVRPGFPAVLIAEPVTFRAVVSQEYVDRWTKDLRLPFRLRLTPDGVVTTTGIGGIRVGEIVTEPTVVGGFLKLRPRRASLLGMPAPLVRFLRGYLPLPPLPRDARLQSVEPGDGELTLAFLIERLEQPLTPDVMSRLQRVVRLPLPGLG